MAKHIAFLRGINVGGQKKILVNDLKTLCESIGLKKVGTYIQSGNIIFETSIKSRQRIEGIIEEGILNKFGFDVSAVVVNDSSLKKVIEGNPYPAVSRQNPVMPYVLFLKTLPEPALSKEITKPNGDTGEFTVDGTVIYLNVPDGYGRTKMNNTFFEKKLKVISTARNWKTVRALSKIADSI